MRRSGVWLSLLTAYKRKLEISVVLDVNSLLVKSFSLLWFVYLASFFRIADKTGKL